MRPKEVLFYRKSDGKCPVEDFLDHLPPKTAQKVVWIISLIEDLDRIPSHYFCKLAGTDDLWEFRIKWESNIFRVLAFFDGAKVILTHGFAKKTQKTSVREIEKAEQYKKDYFARTGGGRS